MKGRRPSDSSDDFGSDPGLQVCFSRRSRHLTPNPCGFIARSWWRCFKAQKARSIKSHAPLSWLSWRGVVSRRLRRWVRVLRTKKKEPGAPGIRAVPRPWSSGFEGSVEEAHIWCRQWRCLSNLKLPSSESMVAGVMGVSKTFSEGGWFSSR